MEDKHCPGIDVKLYSVILEKCLQVLGLPNEYSAIGGGDCGKAFLVNGKVYKITTDQSEAIESAKLIGKRNYFLADIYDAKKIHTTLTNTPTFLVVGEKLRTDRDSIFYEMQEELSSIISEEIGEHLFDILYYYRFKQHYYNDVYKPEVDYALNTHQREKFYYNSLLSICDELRKNNIQSLDLQYHNLGLKPNGNLAFFDLGFGEEEQGRLNSIDIGEQIVERIMSYMKGSSAMKVKKKCQIGGNGDGTSTACNQGDISNIELSPIKEEIYKFVENEVNSNQLRNDIESLKPALASAAQNIYNQWEQDEEGYDEMYGGGGICDDIANAMCEVVHQAHHNCFTLYNEGYCHTSIYVYDTEKKQLYNVDIPPFHYENGTAYTWKKINGVTFTPNMIEINDISGDWDNYFEPDGEVKQLNEHTSRWNKMLQRKWKDLGKTHEASPEQMEQELRDEKAITVDPEYVQEIIDYEVNKINPTFEPMTTEAVKIGLNDLPFKADVEQAGGKIYSVGGAVRDNIIGRESKDLDILITGVPMDTLDKILRKYGKVDNVGKSFGVIKFNSSKTGELDIAIPRTERKNAQGGHRGFDVTSDHTLPVEKDLERRDFTINAIAKDSKGVIIDPYCGQGDIEKKCIRMVNPQAFSDDPLRMLRAVQFAARFGFEIEPQTMASIQQNAAGIKTEPFERILTEFDKIVKKGNPLIGAKLLRQTGLYAQIFGTNRGINLANFTNVKTLGEFVYGLIKDTVANPAEFFKEKMGGDNDSYREIQALELGQKFNGEFKTIFDMYKLSPKSIDTTLFGEKFTNSVNYMKEHNIPFSLKGLAVKGGDLIKDAGYTENSPEIGKTLANLMTVVYNEELPNEREALLNYVKSKQNVSESIYSVTGDDYRRLTDEDLKRQVSKILNLQIKNPEGKVNYISDEELHDFFFAYLATIYNKDRVDAITSQLTNADDIKYNDNKYYIIQKLRDVGLLK